MRPILKTYSIRTLVHWFRKPHPCQGPKPNIGSNWRLISGYVMWQFRLSSSLASSISSQRFLFQVIAYEDLSLGVTVQEQYHACDVIIWGWVYTLACIQDFVKPVKRCLIDSNISDDTLYAQFKTIESYFLVISSLEF